MEGTDLDRNGTEGPDLESRTTVLKPGGGAVEGDRVVNMIGKVKMNKEIPSKEKDERREEELWEVLICFLAKERKLDIFMISSGRKKHEIGDCDDAIISISGKTSYPSPPPPPVVNPPDHQGKRPDYGKSAPSPPSPNRSPPKNQGEHIDYGKSAPSPPSPSSNPSKHQGEHIIDDGNSAPSPPSSTLNNNPNVKKSTPSPPSPSSAPSKHQGKFIHLIMEKMDIRWIWDRLILI